MDCWAAWPLVCSVLAEHEQGSSGPRDTLCFRRFPKLFKLLDLLGGAEGAEGARMVRGRFRMCLDVCRLPTLYQIFPMCSEAFESFLNRSNILEGAEGARKVRGLFHKFFPRLSEVPREYWSHKDEALWKSTILNKDPNLNQVEPGADPHDQPGPMGPTGPNTTGENNNPCCPMRSNVISDILKHSKTTYENVIHSTIDCGSNRAEASHSQTPRRNLSHHDGHSYTRGHPFGWRECSLWQIST